MELIERVKSIMTAPKTESLRLEGAFNYFLEKDLVSGIWALMLIICFSWARN
jgi:hypothetical protein